MFLGSRNAANTVNVINNKKGRRKKNLYIISIR